MFIKKDLRKITEILDDESDDKESLKLFKRLDWLFNTFFAHIKSTGPMNSKEISPS